VECSKGTYIRTLGEDIGEAPQNPKTPEIWKSYNFISIYYKY
jgi:hypothetical protein